MLDVTSGTFSQSLTDAHSDLESSFDALIAKNKFNVT